MKPGIHHIIPFTWPVLLLISKARVEKIFCGQLSVNMAAKSISGTDKNKISYISIEVPIVILTYKQATNGSTHFSMRAPSYK